jgi:hypothetical protein
MGPNQLRIESFLEQSAAPRKRQVLGYVILERPSVGLPFQVKKRHPESKDNDSILVTCSGVITPGAVNEFLREGYTFHYGDGYLSHS